MQDSPQYDVIDIAYAALLHDIGKFYQRTKLKSDLNDDEKRLTPIAQAGYHTHLHSGYTSRFFHKYLLMNNELEFLASSHHRNEINDFAIIIKRADQIASAIDRNDEEYDIDEKNDKGNFIQTRLTSVLGEVNFGKSRKQSTFMLSPLSKINYPICDFSQKSKEDSALEYHNLFSELKNKVKEDSILHGNITQSAFDHMYSLLYEYCTTIPASTYEGNKTFVSLFDHLKLTTAIASCLYYSGYDRPEFYMLEFDVSGIQNFIFKVTEGSQTKSGIAKSLRGRSIYISLITGIITHAYLHEFGLTQANIIFNTGGGALILLPALEDTKVRVEALSNQYTELLYKKFNTDLTFVYSIEKCDEKELETFKIDKAISLKANLDKVKNQKFTSMMGKDEFYFESGDEKEICSLCGTALTDGNICGTCKQIEKISEFYTGHENICLIYDYSHRDLKLESNSQLIDFGLCQLWLVNATDAKRLTVYDYIESLNEPFAGNTRYVANLVPKANNNRAIGLNFAEIAENLVPEEMGSKKLAILKMDVDNLGAVFAFGLSSKEEGKDLVNARSLSKFLTLSRLVEIFFSIKLKEICLDVSAKINPNIAKLTSNGNMFYINYAGGDDLVIVGPVYGIVELAKEINKKFCEFTNNKNITISGGIYIQNPKEPIRFGVKEAEAYLNASKQVEEKNSLTLLGVTVPFPEYEELLNEVHRYVNWINTGKISRTTFYNLMTLINTKDYDLFEHRIPLILYTLSRNVDYEIMNTLKIRIAEIKDNETLNKLVLGMKLTVLFTRKDG